MTSTLDEVMRAPSTNVPEIVVLDSTHEEKNRKASLNPNEDLWLSSADGRYNSPVIPLRVGEAFDHVQTFYVHKSVLLKSEYFRKALCGEFKEAETQVIDLPEEDPAIFHFIVAFLYEEKYVPIKPIASVLGKPIDDKGKGLEGDDTAASDSDSDIGSIQSDSSSARSRRLRERRRRREDRHWERLRQKHPGAHRFGCGCRQCVNGGGPPCWHCAAPRLPPAPMPVLNGIPPGMVIVEPDRRARHRRRAADRRHRLPSPPPMRPATALPTDPNRIQGEDLRSWLLTYEMNLDCYICANKFLLDDFKLAIARVCIDMLETAGPDAAQAEVLQLCYKLYQGLPESDPLMKMVFARVGFMQPLLWRRVPQQTSDFLLTHPEISALILKETVARREQDHVNQLPAMERPLFPPPPPPPEGPYGRPGGPVMGGRPRW
ncbi:uncharacterized protein BCR38DRAFT_346643 [Pseudomassariella vexata]|uniref:BTB domain-containing protein n=1 Tax=Pseudomassariella vexata TaxID=1141098 RepID=A0A1Y2DSR7_9PEZI|nr:uncharacterized protein BCR38DRAFT_346643 [Pseudomassariella vexata]ORY62209.1 hypothetical protein BCR38DRAFT_346643 [Pseudomassariella vexata]